jgi:hypothetical protein
MRTTERRAACRTATPTHRFLGISPDEPELSPDHEEVRKRSDLARESRDAGNLPASSY